MNLSRKLYRPFETFCGCDPGRMTRRKAELRLTVLREQRAHTACLAASAAVWRSRQEARVSQARLRRAPPLIVPVAGARQDSVRQRTRRGRPGGNPSASHGRSSRRTQRPRSYRRSRACPHWLWPPTRRTPARPETTPLPLQPMTSLKTQRSHTRRRLADATARKSRGPTSRARGKTPEGRD